MYSVADTLLRWDEISLQRDLFKKATYTAFALYTLCTEINRDMGTAIPRDVFQWTACLMSEFGSQNQPHMKCEQAKWKIQTWSWEVLIIQDSLCFQSLVSRQAGGKFSTAQGQPIHLATLRIEDLGAPHQFSEYTADPSNLNPVPNDIGHNHPVSVGLVLIPNTSNT